MTDLECQLNVVKWLEGDREFQQQIPDIGGSTCPFHHHNTFFFFFLHFLRHLCQNLGKCGGNFALNDLYLPIAKFNII